MTVIEKKRRLRNEDMHCNKAIFDITIFERVGDQNVVEYSESVYSRSGKWAKSDQNVAKSGRK